MIFITLWQFLGDHVPALGAFCVQLVVVAFVCFLFYKWGEHKANKRWTYDVEHNSDFLAHDIRERFEKRETITQTRNKFLEDRNGELIPSIKALTDTLTVLAQGKRE